MDPFSEVRDQFVIDIAGITDKFYSNAITALLFLAYILFLVYIIRISIRGTKENKKRKKETLEYEKNLIKSLKNNPKNKK